MWAKPTPSRMTNKGPGRTCPTRAPQTRHSSHQGNFIETFYFIYFYFIYLHNHSFIISHTRIHSSHTSEASHTQLNASQRSVLSREAAVASFNMSNDRPGFEGRPTKGLEVAPRQTELGEKMQMSLEWRSPSLL